MSDPYKPLAYYFIADNCDGDYAVRFYSTPEIRDAAMAVWEEEYGMNAISDGIDCFSLANIEG